MNFYMLILNLSPAGAAIRCWCSYLVSVCELFLGSDDELWRIVFFTVFLWDILFLLFWGLHLRIIVRPVDINTTSNSKQCGKGHMSEGHSSSNHNFPSFEILMSRHKVILKEDKSTVRRKTEDKDQTYFYVVWMTCLKHSKKVCRPNPIFSETFKTALILKSRKQT